VTSEFGPAAPRRAGYRAAQALLLLGIVALSSVLLLNYTVSASPNQPPNSPPRTNPPTNSQSGQLEILVTVSNPHNETGISQVANASVGTSAVSALLFPTNSTLSGNYTISSPSIQTLALSPVSFSAIGVGLTQAPVHFNVSQPGRSSAIVAPGLYRVSTSNEYYRLSLYAQVLANSVTDVHVTVNQIVSPVVFAQVFDLDSAGIVQSWEPITIQVSGLSEASLGSTIFIAYPNSGPSGRPPSSAQAFLSTLANVLQADQRTDGIWLVVSLRTPVAMQSLRDLYVENVAATYEVNTSAA